MLKRLLITHSLLNAWQYIYKANEEEMGFGENVSPNKVKNTAYDCFCTTLNRISAPPTEAMIAEREFEQFVSVLANNAAEISVSRETSLGAAKIAGIVSGGAEQVRLSKAAAIKGTDYLLYGIPDWVKAGVIYDIKHKRYLSRYNAGDYYGNTQYRMYFALESGAHSFVYLISDGSTVYQEEYRREDTEPVEHIITEFEQWLKSRNLWNKYTEKWQTRT